MTYKEKSKKSLDKYIKTATTVKGGPTGSRRQAWAEIKALELLVKAASEK